MYKKEKNHEALDTVILTEVRENPSPWINEEVKGNKRTSSDKKDPLITHVIQSVSFELGETSLAPNTTIQLSLDHL